MTTYIIGTEQLLRDKKALTNYIQANKGNSSLNPIHLEELVNQIVNVSKYVIRKLEEYTFGYTIEQHTQYTNKIELDFIPFKTKEKEKFIRNILEIVSEMWTKKQFDTIYKIDNLFSPLDDEISALFPSFTKDNCRKILFNYLSNSPKRNDANIQHYTKLWTVYLNAIPKQFTYKTKESQEINKYQVTITPLSQGFTVFSIVNRNNKLIADVYVVNDEINIVTYMHSDEEPVSYSILPIAQINDKMLHHPMYCPNSEIIRKVLSNILIAHKMVMAIGNSVNQPNETQLRNNRFLDIIKSSTTDKQEWTNNISVSTILNQKSTVVVTLPKNNPRVTLFILGTTMMGVLSGDDDTFFLHNMEEMKKATVIKLLSVQTGVTSPKEVSYLNQMYEAYKLACDLRRKIPTAK